MSDRDGQRLVDLLEQQLFAPIIDSNPDRLPPHQRELAANVRRELAHERERVRGSGSAVAIAKEFGAYAAEHSADLDPRLSELGFPTLGDLRHEVEKLSAELGLQSPGRGPVGTRR